MVGYAKGTHALGLCDRCGFQYRLNSLKFQEFEGRLTSLKVCRFCYDVDNEQWMVRLLDTTDNQSLRDPRPEPPISGTDFLLMWGPESTLNFGQYRPLAWQTALPDTSTEVDGMLLWGLDYTLTFGPSSTLLWDS